jgi:hypothetical protein
MVQANAPTRKLLYLAIAGEPMVTERKSIFPKWLWALLYGIPLLAIGVLIWRDHAHHGSWIGLTGLMGALIGGSLSLLGRLVEPRVIAPRTARTWLLVCSLLAALLGVWLLIGR